MTSPTLFRGGQLFDGDRFLEADCLRTDGAGKIVEIGASLPSQPGEDIVDLEGKWLLPGLVDCHVHFRDPGLERKEGYAFGSAGALHGGVTTVGEIQNNPPLMDSVAVLKQKLAKLRGVSRVDYMPYGSLVEPALPELTGIHRHCAAVKCFLGCSTGAGGVDDEATMRRWFQAAADAGVKVVAHCEDNHIMAAADAKYGDDPDLASRHDLRRPVEAEAQSVKDAIAVAEDVGLALHVFHISTYAGAKMVVEAAERGLPVTGSTAPHYLLIEAEEAHQRGQNRFKVNPSIKYAEDRAGLLKLVASGALPVVGTDHAPHPLDEKDRPYAKAPSGFPSVDLLLPLMVAAADLAEVTPEAFLHAVTKGPAEEFGLAQKGRLAVGADADLVIADASAKRVVEESTLLSRSKWSPYHGRELRAFPERVYLRGSLVFADGQVQGEPQGEPLFA